jgi:uncharacterized protein YfaT (DUF1175 family)
MPFLILSVYIQAPDCDFELVDNRDQFICREIDYCPARTGDFMIFSKPGDGFLYVFATFRANRRQHIIVDNTGWPRFRS